MDNKSSTQTAIIVAIITVIGGIIVALINSHKSQTLELPTQATQINKPSTIDPIDAFASTIKSPNEWINNFDSVLSDSRKGFKDVIGTMINIKTTKDETATFLIYNSKLDFSYWTETIIQLLGQEDKVLSTSFELDYPNIVDTINAFAIFEGARKLINEKSSHDYDELEVTPTDNMTLKKYRFRPKALIGVMTWSSFNLEIVKKNNLYQIQININTPLMIPK